MGARGSFRGRFSPAQFGVVGAWYRLAASDIVGGEYVTVTDVLGGSSLVQNDTDRRLAASSTNGLPTMVYDGSDVMRMPLGANNYSTSKFGFALWVVPTGLAGGQNYFAIYNNDAGLRSVVLGNAATGRLNLQVFIGSNVDGRNYASGAVMTSGVPCFLRVQLDMAKTNECDLDGLTADAKVRIFVNETAVALTATDFGAGGTLTTLRSPVGSAIWGGLNDTDTPSGPTADGHVHGPNTYLMTNTPTQAQAQAMMNFEALV